MTPEERAQETCKLLGLLDKSVSFTGPPDPVSGTPCGRILNYEVFIAAAIRAAENEALERAHDRLALHAAWVQNQCAGRLQHRAEIDARAAEVRGCAEIVRSLKHPEAK
jgi:uncharacterized membrane protein YqiK